MQGAQAAAEVAPAAALKAPSGHAVALAAERAQLPPGHSRMFTYSTLHQLVPTQAYLKLVTGSAVEKR